MERELPWGTDPYPPARVCRIRPELTAMVDQDGDIANARARLRVSAVVVMLGMGDDVHPLSSRCCDQPLLLNPVRDLPGILIRYCGGRMESGLRRHRLQVSHGIHEPRLAWVGTGATAGAGQQNEAAEQCRRVSQLDPFIHAQLLDHHYSKLFIQPLLEDNR